MFDETSERLVRLSNINHLLVWNERGSKRAQCISLVRLRENVRFISDLISGVFRYLSWLEKRNKKWTLQYLYFVTCFSFPCSSLNSLFFAEPKHALHLGYIYESIHSAFTMLACFLYSPHKLILKTEKEKHKQYKKIICFSTDNCNF